MGRRLGQHFLADESVARRIVAALEPGDEPVLEIGGGRGALTRHLAGCGDLTVVELDDRLAAGLRARYPAATVLTDDVLNLDLGALRPGARWAVVGNLPYYRTTAILTWLVSQHRAVARAVVMVQREVAERMAAPPGGRDYGRLSVMIQYRCAAEMVLRVPPGSFRPPPRVDSAVVRLDVRDRPPVEVADERRFFDLVEHGFRWRRKSLGNVLRRWREWTAEQAEQALSAAGIEPSRRAETLGLEDFARLDRAVAATEPQS